MIALLSQPGIARLKPVASCALAIALSALPIRAQKGSPPGGGSGGSRGTPGGGTSSRPFPPPLQPGMQPNPDPGVFLPTPEPIKKPVVVEDEACFPWDLSEGRGATVS